MYLETEPILNGKFSRTLEPNLKIGQSQEKRTLPLNVSTECLQSLSLLQKTIKLQRHSLSNMLYTYGQNVNGLRSKWNLLKQNVATCILDVGYLLLLTRTYPLIYLPQNLAWTALKHLGRIDPLRQAPGKPANEV